MPTEAIKDHLLNVVGGDSGRQRYPHDRASSYRRKWPRTETGPSGHVVADDPEATSTSFIPQTFTVRVANY